LTIQLIPLYQGNFDYITQAINTLVQCSKINPSFTDIVQLFNLFFEYAYFPDICNTTAEPIIRNISSSLLLKCFPQILIQLSHNSNYVSDFIHSLVLDLLKEHYHSLIFSLYVMTISQNQKRSAGAKSILGKFKITNPDLINEVVLIRKSLLGATVTSYEQINQTVSDYLEFFHENNYSKFLSLLESVCKMVENPKCELQKHFFININLN
jgi:hypothetical protein